MAFPFLHKTFVGVSAITEGSDRIDIKTVLSHADGVRFDQVFGFFLLLVLFLAIMFNTFLEIFLEFLFFLLAVPLFFDIGFIFQLMFDFFVFITIEREIIYSLITKFDLFLSKTIEIRLIERKRIKN